MLQFIAWYGRSLAKLQASLVPHSPPKYRFRFWLVVQVKLLTTDNLIAFCPGTDRVCSVYNFHLESHSHLFFYCHFPGLLLDCVCNWLDCLGPLPSFHIWKQWFHSLKLNKLSNHICVAVLQDLVYVIRMNRNACIFRQSCFSIQFCTS